MDYNLPALTLFGVLSIGGIGFSLPQIQTVTPPPGNDSLDHYLQWGLFDSLYSASSNALADWKPSPDSVSVSQRQTLGRLHQMRALACLFRQDSLQARQDFVAAACWKSALRLDSFYVPIAMIRIRDSLFRQVEAQPSLCMANPAAMAWRQSQTASIMGSRDSIPSAPKVENGLASSANASAPGHSVWGWSLGGLALGAGLETAFEQWAMAAAHQKQTAAALAGEADAYDKRGGEVRTHFVRRNAALAATLLIGAGSAYAFYHHHHISAQAAPQAVTFAWTF